MPTYLLTIFDHDGDGVETPYEADNDIHAERDAADYTRRLGDHFGGIARYTVETLSIGRFDPATGTIDTRRPTRLFDSGCVDMEDDDTDLAREVDMAVVPMTRSPRPAPIPTAAEDALAHPFP